MAPISKKELEEKVRKLTELLHVAQEKINDLTAKRQSDSIKDNLGIGGFYDDETRKWKLVVIEYNKDDLSSQVKEIRDAGDSFNMLKYRMEEFITDNILLPFNRRK